MENNTKQEEEKSKLGELTVDELQEKYETALRRSNLRKAAVYKAKIGIKNSQKALEKLNQDLKEEGDKEIIKELKETRAQVFGLLSQDYETLKELKRNKLGSENYEFKPSLGNRRSRKLGRANSLQR